MKDQVNNGAPAFPRTGSYGRDAQEGMSLRDYFAAKAMASLVADYGRGVTDGKISRSDNFPASVSDAAYAIADAMLKARGEK